MSAVAEFFESFGRAFSHLVVWAFLLGVAAHLLQTVVRSRAWRNYLAQSFPSSTVRWRDAYGAYLVKQGAGVFLPMHGDDVVRVGLMKDRIEGASPAAIVATAGVETVFEVLVTAALVGVSAWLGTSVIDWHEVAAHPAGPAVVAGIVLLAIVSPARVMIGPLHLCARLRERLRRTGMPAPVEPAFASPQPVGEGPDAA
jgi:hypothetical protein